jgi:two-component system, sensor histidine kinase
MSTDRSQAGPEETRPELLRKIEKLSRINEALMGRVEQSMDRQGNAFSLFQAAIALEAQVRARTGELRQVLRKLERTNAQLTAAKEEAEKANLSKTRFLAAASHDLLQPVISAKLAISSLAGLQQSPDGARLAHQAEGSLQTIEDLIKTLLDISKLDAGVVTPEIRKFALGDLLEGLQATFQSAAPDGVRLKVRPSGLMVESDPVLLKSVLLNLVSNAIHYTKTGGVLVGVRRRGAACYLEVYDTGIGIPDREQALIFAEFYRGSSANGRNRTGLGLGLSIVQRITQALGHELALKSEPGKGTRFRLTLPVAGWAAPRSEAAPSLASLTPLRGKSVLIVENEAHAAKVMQELLEEWGCQTFLAPGLSDAASLLDSLDRLPDIIAADYHLDGNDRGVAAIEAIRAIDPSIPALVVTADHSAETAKAVRAAGAMLLHKPVSPGRLRAAVTHLAGLGRV